MCAGLCIFGGELNAKWAKCTTLDQSLALKFRRIVTNMSIVSVRQCYAGARSGGTPMSEANKALIRRWFEEVWNKQNEDAIDEMFDAQGKSHGIPEPDAVLVGREAFKALHRTFCGAFPDMHFELHDLIAEGDRVAVRWVVNMTHLGDQLGIPPTITKVGLAGSSFLEIKDGMIQEGWNYMELQGLLENLKRTAASADAATSSRT
jgi:steroid delta-isomerase-like uncharacterized protein